MSMNVNGSTQQTGTECFQNMKTEVLRRIMSSDIL
jgi:hypothetical protein